MFLILLVVCASLYFTFFRSTKKAYLAVFIPCLLLLPQGFKMAIRGFPELSFSEAAILPVGLSFLLLHAVRWRFSWMDILVIGLAVWFGVTKGVHEGYWVGQQSFFYAILHLLFPYMLAKGLIQRYDLNESFAKRFAICCFITALLYSWQLLMKENLYRRVLDSFFTPQWGGWLTFSWESAYKSRWGFLPRIRGPYTHAIHAGLVMFIAYRLARWVHWKDVWKPRFKTLHPGLITKGGWILLVLALGCLLSSSRGPWIGALVAGVVCSIGLSRSRMWGLMSRALVLGVGAIVIYAVYIAPYQHLQTTGWGGIEEEGRTTANYRLQLFRRSLVAINQRKLYGWGDEVPGGSGEVKSTDNVFVWFGVTKGLPALGLFVAILLSIIIRLFWKAMNGPFHKPRGSDLSFTLFGLFVGITVTVWTVWMDAQTLTIFFTLLGWAEGFLISPAKSFKKISSPQHATKKIAYQLPTPVVVT